MRNLVTNTHFIKEWAK